MTAKKRIWLGLAITVASSTVFWIAAASMVYAMSYRHPAPNEHPEFMRSLWKSSVLAAPYLAIFALSLVLGRPHLNKLSWKRFLSVASGAGVVSFFVLLLLIVVAIVSETRHLLNDLTGPPFMIFLWVVGILVVTQTSFRILGPASAFAIPGPRQWLLALKRILHKPPIKWTWRERTFAALGFLIAPIFAALTLSPFFEHMESHFEVKRLRAFYEASLTLGGLFGLPAFLILRRLRLAHWWLASLVGASIGAGCAWGTHFESKYFFGFLWPASGALAGMAFWAVWKLHAPLIDVYTTRKLLIMTITLIALFATGDAIHYVDVPYRSMRGVVAEFKVSSSPARWWRCQGVFRPLLAKNTRAWQLHYSWDIDAMVGTSTTPVQRNPYGATKVMIDLDSSGKMSVRSMRVEQPEWAQRSLQLPRAVVEEFERAVDGTGLLCQSTVSRIDPAGAYDPGRLTIQVAASGWTRELVRDRCHTLPDAPAWSEVLDTLKAHEVLPEEFKWGIGSFGTFPLCENARSN